METLTGRFERLLYQNDKGTWGVGVMIDAEGVEIKIVGALLNPRPGDIITVKGQTEDDPKFGPQFRVKNFDFSEAKDRTGIVGYLERLPNIGPVRAATIHREFKDETFEVIENHPERLVQAPGITHRMVDNIHEAYMAEKTQRDLIVFLKQFELTDHKIARIMETYGRDLAVILKNDPYRMIQDIHGFGFKTVDVIAQSAGVARSDPARIQAGLLFVLQEAEQEGHTYLPLHVLLKVTVKLLLVPSDKLLSVLEKMVKENTVITERGTLFALSGLYTAESRVAERFIEVMACK